MDDSEPTMTDPSSIVDLEDLGKIENVMGDIETLAQEYGDFADRMLRAKMQNAAIKYELTNTEAALGFQIRKDNAIQGVKLTDKAAASYVDSHSQVVMLRQRLAASDALVDRYQMALKVLDKKERMLDILGRSQIREFGVIQRTQ